MRSPFPGMDPYLENPALWPDVHNSLIAAVRETLAPKLAPRYYIGLERRVYRLAPDDLIFVGRPDASVLSERTLREAAPPYESPGVIEVTVPMTDEVEESFLEVRTAAQGEVVTVLELLSPINKLGAGRQEYLHKRDHIFKTRTHLVEIDLLRAGQPMPVIPPAAPSDYRILISRSAQRPRAQLYTFSVRQPIPDFPLPLLADDVEPNVELNTILHELYERVRFDLTLDYAQPATPPLSEADAEWARTLIQH
ncbi:MAG: DUF4058 family protein [Anaerolineales bacterium]